MLSSYVFFLPIGFNLINRCLCAVYWTWRLFVCDIWFNRQDSLSIFLFYLVFFCKVNSVFYLKKKHDAHVTYAPDCIEIIINFICYNNALYLQLFKNFFYLYCVILAIFWKYSNIYNHVQLMIRVLQILRERLLMFP